MGKLDHPDLEKLFEASGDKTRRAESASDERACDEKLALVERIEGLLPPGYEVRVGASRIHIANMKREVWGDFATEGPAEGSRSYRGVEESPLRRWFLGLPGSAGADVARPAAAAWMYRLARVLDTKSRRVFEGMLLEHEVRVARATRDGDQRLARDARWWLRFLVIRYVVVETGARVKSAVQRAMSGAQP